MKMIKRSLSYSRFFFFTAIVVVLSACGGSDGDGNEFLTSEFLNKLIVSGSEGSQTVNNKNRTDLTITGISNTVSIETDLRKLVVSGGNNLLNFTDNISVGSCTVSGSDNSVVRSGSLTMNCKVTGAGNVGF